MQNLPLTSIALKIWNCYITLGYGTPILSVQSMNVIEWNLYRGAIFPVLQTSDSTTLLRLAFSYPFLLLHLLIPRAHMCTRTKLPCKLEHFTMCVHVFLLDSLGVKVHLSLNKLRLYSGKTTSLSVLWKWFNLFKNLQIIFYLFFKAKVSIAKHRIWYRITKAHWAHFGRNKIIYFAN